MQSSITKLFKVLITRQVGSWQGGQTERSAKPPWLKSENSAWDQRHSIQQLHSWVRCAALRFFTCSILASVGNFIPSFGRGWYILLVAGFDTLCVIIIITWFVRVSWGTRCYFFVLCASAVLMKFEEFPRRCIYAPFNRFIIVVTLAAPTACMFIRWCWCENCEKNAV